MITSKDFPSLTDDLQEIFDEVAARKVSENVGFRVFNVFDTNRLSYDYLILHGLEGIKKVAEGADLPAITGEEGDTATWTQSYYGGIVPVTKKMRKFDLYDQITNRVKSVTEDAFDKIDQSLADVLIQGTSATYTDPYGETITNACPDGEVLFYASHSTPLNANVFTNIMNDGTNDNPSLSRDAIVKMRATGLKHEDPNGIIRPVSYDTLIVGPDLEDLAERLIYSEYLPGSANNDRNPLKGKIKNLIVWPRLATASDSTDGSAYWYLTDSTGVKETLKCLFSERPSLDAPEQVYQNKNWEYSLDFFYTIGRGFPAYIAFSDGTDA